MGILKVRVYGDEVLRQKAKEITKISKKIYKNSEKKI